MGHFQVVGLDFCLDYLQRETATFHKFINSGTWLNKDLDSRRAVVKGLAFIMFNLADDVVMEQAWSAFHEVMDEYHAACEALNVPF